MDYAQSQRKPGKHLVGIGIVILMHLLLAWAIVSGLARKVVDVIKAPIETKIIEEVKPPPPPPPESLPPPPKTAPPPPSFIPPPEVQVAPPPTPQPTITTTTVAPPPAPPVRIEAAPPSVVAAPAAPPAPPAPPVRVAPKLDFNVCEKPSYPRNARRSSAEGDTVISYTMDTSGAISDAKIERPSGMTREHRELDRAALEAVLACKGVPGSLGGKPEKLSGTITYGWKLTD